MEKNENRKEIVKAINVALLIVLLAILGQFTSCSPIVCPPVQIIEKTDTVIRERVIIDSVAFEVPVEKEVNMTRDTASHLENTYAKSDAVVTDGVLSHSLESKPRVVYVPYETIVRDTTIVYGKSDVIIKEVEKPLTKWQHLFITLGKAASIYILLAVVYCIVRRRS